MKGIKLTHLYCLIVVVFTITIAHGNELASPLPTSKSAQQQPIESNKRVLPASFKENYKSSAFKYTEPVVKKPKKNFSLPNFNFPIGLFEAISYTLITIIIGLILFFVFKNSSIRFHSISKKNIEPNVNELQENLNDIKKNDFESLITLAKQNQDFSKAIRFYYLWLLQQLTDKKLIVWHKDKTDFDYWKEISNHTIKEDYSGLLYIYDYVWYGKYAIQEADFTAAEKQFITTFNKI